MDSRDFQLRGLSDPRLAVHATSPLPAWLWTVDGKTILWANPLGARLFGARNAAELSRKAFGPADPHRRQIVQLALRLPAGGAIRLQRLRGFGAPFGTLMTCGCRRLEFADGTIGILVSAAKNADPGMPLLERLERLVEGVKVLAAAFAADGMFAGASEPARALLGLPDLSQEELKETRSAALREGQAEAATPLGRLVLQRVGTGDDIGLVALIAPADRNQARPPLVVLAEPEPEQAHSEAAADAPAEHSPEAPRPPAYDEPGLSGEGPAEFALHEEPATPLHEPLTEPGAEAGPDEVGEAIASEPEPKLPATQAEPPTPRRYPLRFTWHTDAAGRFSLDPGEFVTLIGPQTAGRFGRPWAEIAPELGVDGDGRVADALAGRSTWSGLSIDPPVDGGARLPVDLSGLPVYDWTGRFTGFRGFGVCRDLDALNRLDALRHLERSRDPAMPAADADPVHNGTQPQLAATAAPHESAPPSTHDAPPEPAKPDPDTGAASHQPDQETAVEPPPNVVPFRPMTEAKSPALTPHENHAFNELARQLAERLEREKHEQDAQVTAPEQLDPAEPAEFEPPFDAAPADAPEESTSAGAAAPDLAEGAPAANKQPPIAPLQAGEASAEDLAAILDTTADGIIMFDADGRIHACNRSAEALFSCDATELVSRNLVDLFAPESRGVVLDYLESNRTQKLASLLDQGREVLGRERNGGLIPLAMTMCRTRPDGPNFFAVFRDLSQSKQNESELREARRQAERALGMKADMLARIGEEVRAPLNAIISLAETMIGQRFGPIGNERYLEQLKDIRASGERVITVIDGLLELSRIETGKLDLAFASHNLNDLVESCVSLMQPQANRERIIIRTSLAQTLPPVLADANSLRQITTNLISSSIRLAKSGGQVIVSTALTDGGHVALRVRDTGEGLSEREVAIAMEPFQSAPASDQKPDRAGLSLSLTRALAEANRAQFQIKSACSAGTLIEVVFPTCAARG